MKGPIILTPYSSKFINDIGTSTLYTVITYQLVEMAFSSLKCTKWIQLFVLMSALFSNSVRQELIVSLISLKHLETKRGNSTF